MQVVHVTLILTKQIGDHLLFRISHDVVTLATLAQRDLRAPGAFGPFALALEHGDGKARHRHAAERNAVAEFIVAARIDHETDLAFVARYHLRLKTAFPDFLRDLLQGRDDCFAHE